MGKISRKTTETVAENIEATCDGCQFFEKLSVVDQEKVVQRIGSSKDGTCRFNPPDAHGEFAVVNKDDWCGQFS